MTNIIGISCLFHDSACCLLQDGKLVAAVQEERFSRIKNDAGIPAKSFRYCLKKGGISINDVDLIVFYEKPELKISRQLSYGYSKDDSRYKEQLDHQRIERKIRTCFGYNGPIEYHEHHLSHAASSFYVSGYDSAAILVNDGVGEWATTSYAFGKGGNIEIIKQINFPDSVGLFYSTITNYLGFRVNSGEYKVMGLAPYGQTKYKSLLKQLISLENDGGYKLNSEFYDYISGNKMYTEKLELLLGAKARKPETEINQFHKDIASSLQVVLHEIVKHQTEYLYDQTKCENLCLAGGVALNCVANRYIMEHGPFKRLFIQPAAGDAGGAIGAAMLSDRNKHFRKLESIYLGPEYCDKNVEKLLENTGLIYDTYETDDELCEKTAQLIAEGNVIGWYQGKMEFGPRALGNRSILADPRNKYMRDRINKMVKKREGFRPFAPVILEEKMTQHFSTKESSPFMLNTFDVISALNLPAITHVDNSARVQTVNENQNSRLHSLLVKFDRITGCPILLNTSFNVRGEPIVESPENALDCFFSTDINHLIIHNYIISRKENEDLICRYREIHNQLKKKIVESNHNLYTFI